MKRIAKRIWLAISILLIALCGACATRGFPPQGGIANCDRVDTRLWRCAQPTALGLEWLKAQGVKSVVNLRNDPWPGEAAACARLGLVYTNLPMSGVFPPSRDRAREILTVMEDMPSPLAIHCEFGADRTGLMAALWRLEDDVDWTVAEAAREQRQYGGSPFLPCFRRFILDWRP